jgi:hypothetical protein
LSSALPSLNMNPYNDQLVFVEAVEGQHGCRREYRLWMWCEGILYIVITECGQLVPYKSEIPAPHITLCRIYLQTDTMPPNCF